MGREAATQLRCREGTGYALLIPTESEQACHPGGLSAAGHGQMT